MDSKMTVTATEMYHLPWSLMRDGRVVVSNEWTSTPRRRLTIGGNFAVLIRQFAQSPCASSSRRSAAEMRCLVEPALTPSLPLALIYATTRRNISLASLAHGIRPPCSHLLSPSSLHHNPPPLPTGCFSCTRNRPLHSCWVPSTKHSLLSKGFSAPKVPWLLIRDLFTVHFISSSSPSLQQRRRVYLPSLLPISQRVNSITRSSRLIPHHDVSPDSVAYRPLHITGFCTYNHDISRMERRQFDYE
jgi:hypothetical protein